MTVSSAEHVSDLCEAWTSFDARCGRPWELAECTALVCRLPDDVVVGAQICFLDATCASLDMCVRRAFEGRP